MYGDKTVLLVRPWSYTVHSLLRLTIIIVVGKKGLNIILTTDRIMIQILCQISPFQLWSAKQRHLDGLNVKTGFNPRSYSGGVHLLLLPAKAHRSDEHEHRRPGDGRQERYPPR